MGRSSLITASSTGGVWIVWCAIQQAHPPPFSPHQKQTRIPQIHMQTPGASDLHLTPSDSLGSVSLLLTLHNALRSLFWQTCLPRPCVHALRVATEPWHGSGSRAGCSGTTPSILTASARRQAWTPGSRCPARTRMGMMPWSTRAALLQALWKCMGTLGKR